MKIDTAIVGNRWIWGIAILLTTTTFVAFVVGVEAVIGIVCILVAEIVFQGFRFAGTIDENVVFRIVASGTIILLYPYLIVESVLEYRDHILEIRS